MFLSKLNTRVVLIFTFPISWIIAFYCCDLRENFSYQTSIYLSRNVQLSACTSVSATNTGYWCVLSKSNKNINDSHDRCCQCCLLFIEFSRERTISDVNLLLFTNSLFCWQLPLRIHRSTKEISTQIITQNVTLQNYLTIWVRRMMWTFLITHCYKNSLQGYGNSCFISKVTSLMLFQNKPWRLMSSKYWDLVCFY